MRGGGLAAAAGVARANVARWNALASEDAARFRAFLNGDPAAYAGDGTIPPGRAALDPSTA